MKSQTSFWYKKKDKKKKQLFNVDISQTVQCTAPALLYAVTCTVATRE